MNAKHIVARLKMAYPTLGFRLRGGVHGRLSVRWDNSGAQTNVWMARAWAWACRSADDYPPMQPPDLESPLVARLSALKEREKIDLLPEPKRPRYQTAGEMLIHKKMEISEEDFVYLSAMAAWDRWKKGIQCVFALKHGPPREAIGRDYPEIYASPRRGSGVSGLRPRFTILDPPRGSLVVDHPPTNWELRAIYNLGWNDINKPRMFRSAGPNSGAPIRLRYKD